MTTPSFPAGNAIISREGRATEQFRAFLQQLAARVLQTVQSGWATPTGTGSRASINASFTQTVSNPPTQAEVTAISNQVAALSKAVGQLINDLKSAGVIHS